MRKSQNWSNLGSLLGPRLTSRAQIARVLEKLIFWLVLLAALVSFAKRYPVVKSKSSFVCTRLRAKIRNKKPCLVSVWLFPRSYNSICVSPRDLGRLIWHPELSSDSSDCILLETLVGTRTNRVTSQLATMLHVIRLAKAGPSGQLLTANEHRRWSTERDSRCLVSGCFQEAD